METLTSPNKESSFDNTLSDFESDPLLKLLKEPTETVGTHAGDNADEFSHNEDPIVSNNDFLGFKDDEHKSEFTGTPFTETTDSPTGKRVKFERMSKAIVEIIAQVQEPMHEELYKAAAFNRQEREDLQRIRRIFKANARPNETIISGTEYENMLLDRADAWEEYCKELPLTNDEKSDWAEAWGDILKDSDMKVSPGKAFLFTTAMIFLPRWIPLIKEASPRLFGKITGTAPDMNVERKFSWDDESKIE